VAALDRSIIAGAESDEKGGATISKRLPDIDLGQLEELARIQCTQEEAAAVLGARGGYVYVRGPNDARVPSPLPQRESEVA